MSSTDLLLPLQRFQQNVYEKADAVFLRQAVAGKWRSWVWRDAHNEIIRVANYLGKFPPKSHIAIYSQNCAHWIMADLAIWAAGHVSVPVYPSANPESLHQILVHSDCVAVFVGKLPDFAEKRAAMPGSLECIAMHQPHDALLSWDDLIARELPLMQLAVREPEEIATIVYTSGTTGEPKGAMISFAAIASAGTNAVAWVGASAQEKFFSYLPLAHVAERVVVEIAGLYSGGCIAFAESLDTFAQNLRETQPSIFLGVPRIWLKFQQIVLEKLGADRFNLVMRLPLVKLVFRYALRRALGLRDVRIALSGAAVLSVDLIHWYESIGISICEGYAMTENLGYSHFSHPDRRRIGYVGECLPQAEIKFEADGEICLRSPCLMQGYYRDPELTAQTIIDGWLHTGDLGEQDEQGRLKILGRKKELFKTSKGKYIAPAAIEAQLESLAQVKQLLVLGAGLSQPLAIAVIEPADMPDRESIRLRYESALRLLNEKLESHEKLDHIVVVSEPWTVANDMMTPTLKLRRFEIEKFYTAQLARWAAADEVIVWAEPEMEMPTEPVELTQA